MSIVTSTVSQASVITVTIVADVASEENQVAFQIGTLATFLFTISSGGSVFDPNDVVMQVIQPDGTRQEYKSSNSGILRISEGNYAIQILLKQAGRWVYRVTATGSNRGTTGDVVINVDPSEFVSV